MRLSEIRVDMSTFYKVGFGCFSVMFLMNFINFFIQFSSRNVFSHIYDVGSMVFMLMLAGVFWTQINSNGIEISQDGHGLSESELEDAFTEAGEEIGKEE